MYDTLLSLPLFQGMSQADFNSLLQKIRLDFIRYEEGGTIISAGDRCKSFAFLINGTVESSRDGMDGNMTFMEQIDAPFLIEPYSMFGRVGCYQRTYTASTPCSPCPRSTTGIPPPPTVMTTAPERTSCSTTSISTMRLGMGEGTTRR